MGSDILQTCPEYAVHLVLLVHCERVLLNQLHRIISFCWKWRQFAAVHYMPANSLIAAQIASCKTNRAVFQFQLSNIQCVFCDSEPSDFRGLFYERPQAICEVQTSCRAQWRRYLNAQTLGFLAKGMRQRSSNNGEVLQSEFSLGAPAERHETFHESSNCEIVLQRENSQS